VLTPAAEVCGFYLSHPKAVHFNVGPVGEDKLDNRAQRVTPEEAQAKRALAPSVVECPLAAA
jgi:5-methyltetrahydrofolate--homocysteine methyltransferase